MIVDETHPRRDSSDFCEIEVSTIGSIKSSLRTAITKLSETDHPSKFLKSNLASVLIAKGWKTDFEIDPKISKEYPSAIFKIDYFYDLNAEICNHKHRFFLEVSFDNRQNLGTNLLKFEVASINSESHGFRILPILICADEAILKKYKWDGAIADVWEYDHAIRIPYSRVIKNVPILISLRESN